MYWQLNQIRESDAQRAEVTNSYRIAYELYRYGHLIAYAEEYKRGIENRHLRTVPHSRPEYNYFLYFLREHEIGARKS